MAVRSEPRLNINAPAQFSLRPLAHAVAWALVAGWAHAQNLPVNALPSGGRVVSGQASISTSQANRMDIAQQSQNAAINWQSFNIGANAQVNFQQPSAASVALNRVTGQDPAMILGSLNANGQVLILNPNGVLVGRGAQVQVGGMVASTLNLSQENFNAGRYVLEPSGSKAAVVNRGTINSANGGYVAMVGAQVRNEGSIQAPSGHVVLAAADRAALTLDRNKLVAFSVDKGTLNALADNQGLIRAEGGRVLLTAKAADDIVKAVVNNDGVIEATTVRNVGGVIRLMAEGGITTVAGKLDASASQGGNGGFIETSGSSVKIAQSAVITTAAPYGKTGTWLIDPVDFTIAAAGGDISGAVLGGQLATSDVVIASIAGATAGNGDIFVNDNLSWANSNTLTLNAQRNIDFSGGGKLDGGATGNVTLNAGLGAVSGAVISHPGNIVVLGDTLTINAVSGIGTPAVPLRTLVSQAALINSKSGGIALTNGKALTIAASSTGGDIDIRTSVGADGIPAGNGGDISVGTVGTLSGLTTMGSGNISLIAGSGGAGNPGPGGAGGTINVVAPVDAQGAISLAAGSGGDSLSDVAGSSSGGAGGTVSLNGALSATQYVTIRGGNGGNGSGFFAGTGGAGGGIAIFAAATSGKAMTLAGGSGGNGQGMLGNGGSGGGVDIGAPLTTGGSATIEGGRGGDGSGTSGNGGAGGSLGLYTGLTLGGDVSLAAGSGGTPAPMGFSGGTGVVTGTTIDVTAAGSLTVSGDIVPFAGGVTLKAGMGIGHILDTSKTLIILNDPATNDLTLEGASINPSVLYAANKLSISTIDGGAGSAVAPLTTSVNRLSVVAREIFLTNDKAVTVDQLVASHGNVYLNNGTNDITIAGPVVSQATGDAIRLAGKNFLHQGASGSLSAPLGRWIVWSEGPASNIFDGLQSGNDAIWSTSFDALIPTVIQPGNRFVFNSAPPIGTASIKADDIVKIYGNTQSSFTFKAISSDAGAFYDNAFTDPGSTVTISKKSPPLLSSTGAVNSASRTGGIAGGATYSIVVDISKASADVAGIPVTLQAVNGLLTVAPRPIAVGALDTATVYGSAPVPMTATASNLASFDTVTTALTGALTRTMGANSSGGRERVGSYAISQGTLSANANYSIQSFTGGTYSITPLALSVTGVGAANRSYDTTTQVSLTGSAAISPLTGDAVVLGGTGTGTFADKHAGLSKPVAVSGFTISGADAANYSLVQPAGVTADITKATLPVSGLTALNKVYDTAVNAPLSGTATITALGSDTVTLTGTPLASFADPNAGTAKAVSVSGLGLSGADANNYILSPPSGLTANIAKAPLPITGLIANNKVYDATANATVSGTPAIVPLGLDTLSLSGMPLFTFADKNVGAAKVVAASGFTLSGSTAGNYQLIQPSGLAADIAPAALAISGLSANHKVYDATINASLSGSASITALGTDTLTLAGTPLAVFANKTVGIAKPVTVSGFSLSGADAGNYTLAQPSGLTANITPAALTVSGVAANHRVYDATTNATLSGTPVVTPLGLDNVSVSGTAAASFADKNVGMSKPVTVSGFSLSGADAGNYTLAQPSGLTANITPAALTVSGVAANHRVYDATTNATLSGTPVVTPLGLDNVSVSGTAAASFADKNVGMSKPVTVSGFSLSGADAGNYTLAQPSGLTANITPAALTVSGVAANHRVYDATTNATLSGTPVVTPLGLDNVSVSGTAAASFADKNVGMSKPVTVSGFSLSGADAGNYTLAQPSGLTANITPAALTVSGVAANHRVYDATTNATLSGTPVVTPLGLDNVSVSGTAAASFADKNVGMSKPVTVSGFSLSGADAGNYTLAQPSGLTANITPAALTVSGVAANHRVYDATTNATLSGTPVVTPLGLDNVSVSGTAAASFADKNVGVSKPVTVSGFSLSGADAGNYTLAQPSGLTANITPAALTVSGVAANHRVYDATTQATLNGTPVVMPLGLDNVAVSGTAAASFADKNVGVSKPVTVSGFSLSGADAGNYTLAQPSGLTANITPAALTVSGVAANHRVYDATTNATLSGTPVVTALGLDNVAVSGTAAASFADKNVGVSKPVTVSGFSLSGADAGNYTLAQPSGLTANITPAALTVSGVAANHRVYDATTNATLSGTPVVTALGLDNVAVSGTAAASFADKNVGVSKPVTVSGFSLSGADAGNYTLAQPSGLTANITPAALTVSGVAANHRVYDATTNATLSGTPVVTALSLDNVAVSGTAAASFADKNVGVSKPVTVSGFSLSGADAGNYTLAQPSGLTANITPLAITGMVTVLDKVYDANADATVASRTLTGVLGSDIVSYVGGVATFNDKNAGNAKRVNVSGLSLSGADGANYSVNDIATSLASITPKTLTVTFSGVSKMYDGTTSATVSARDNRIGNDALTVSQTASFRDASAGTAKSILISSVRLAGPDSANYTVAATGATSADITSRPLAITARDATKVYGDPDPSLIFSIAGSGLASGDTMTNVISGALARAPGENVSGSPYAITQGSLSVNSNYAITAYTPGQFNITPRPLTITADYASMMADGLLPPFSASYSGFAFADTAASLKGMLAYITSANSLSAPGLYSVTPTGQSSSNYAISYVSGTLEINADPANTANSRRTASPTVAASSSDAPVQRDPAPAVPKAPAVETRGTVIIESTGINLPPGVP